MTTAILESPSTEKHYTPAEIAEIMGLSRTTVYKLLEDEPGVVKIGERGLNRTRITYRVPESVWRRIHQKWTVKG
ncbi:MAG: hypothetical protein KGL39_58565 [Patescibacteria group bacterium]|nr:hypothetical protein [Patescibacteria group bacterium]